MIHEAYVSFETAKLLKEKGFDEPCYMSYWLRTKDNIELAHLEQHCNNYSDCMCAPTLQMACAWLRGKGFEIGVFYLFKAINPDVTVFDGYIANVTHVIDGVYKDSWDMDVVKDYNVAVERALKYVLENLI
jgi:hypothetical protein